MLREALRRLLWLVPTVFLATAPIFWALARATPTRPTDPTAGLPMFLNLSPDGVRERVDGAVQDLVGGTARIDTAGAELVAIGGAALPHLLPRLDSLGPEARGRVALALAPLASRMNVGDEANFASPESAILFWNRFWEEHQIDFRPAVVRRAVRRFAERPSAIRETELRRLDTFALPELVEAMRVRLGAADLAGVRHLSRLASSVTTREVTLPDDATPDDARNVVLLWETFLREQGSRYRTLTGATRAAAMLLETRYGKWAQSVVTSGADLARHPGRAATTGELRSRAMVTLLLVSSTWVIGSPLGFLIVAITRRTTNAGKRRLATFCVLLGASATAVGLAAGVGGAIGGAAGAILVLTIGWSSTLAARSGRAWDRVMERPFVQGCMALGASRMRADRLALRAVLGPWLSGTILDLPALMTAAFVVEHAFHLQGLGEPTIWALRSGNVTWLLGLALSGALSVGVGQVVADSAHRLLDPRLDSKLRARGGHLV